MTDVDFRDVWGLAKSDPDWPDRLLHVESWTSFVRGDDNSYGGVVEPRYNILSYTWGRWMLESPGPSLSLQGIAWDVPAVDPEKAFTVDQFRKVIERVAHGVDFVWVDIACIHQDDRPAKMKEVGRQASIFQGAENAFVWLHQWSDDQLERNIRRLNEAWTALDQEMTIYESEAYGNADSDSVENDAPSCFSDDSWIESVIDVLDTWRSEPWFTSLWTLEEMYLKPLAIFLSKSGSTTTIGDELVGLKWLMMCVNTIQEELQSLYVERPIPRHLDETRLNQIIVGADRLGVDSAMWSNSCVIFAATRHRQVWDPLDRVYGIMQVFGFQLGESIDPHGSFTLPQLKLQLVAKMTERHPVFSQFFLHAEPAPLGLGWMIGDHSWTPLRLTFPDLRPLAMCEIDVDQINATATFKGHSRDFRTFAAMYKKIVTLEGEEAWDTWQDIMFDCNPTLLSFVPGDILNQSRMQPNLFHKVADILVEGFGDRLRLLFLGALQDAGHNPYLDDDDGEAKDLGIGILVLPEMSGDRSVVWRRIGLCTWQEPTESSEHFEEFGGMWEAFSGFLG